MRNQFLIKCQLPHDGSVGKADWIKLWLRGEVRNPGHPLPHRLLCAVCQHREQTGGDYPTEPSCACVV